MTNALSLAVIESLMEDMETDEILAHYEKTQNPEVKDFVEEELVDRLQCPECSNPLSKDVHDMVYYCGVCDFELDVDE